MKTDNSQLKPIAYMRKWAFDKELEFKVLNPKTNRMKLHNKFIFHRVTESQVFPDDIPLFARHDVDGELLQALQSLMEAFASRMGDWENPEFNKSYCQAKDAIAKATGGDV